MGAEQGTTLFSFIQQIFLTTYNVLVTVVMTEDTILDKPKTLL